MSSSDNSTATVPDNTAAHDEDARLLHRAGLQLLHEATLQDLIRARNYAVDKILCERNDLLRERISLGGSPIEYSEVDFLSPVDAMRPYKIIDGRVTQFYSEGPHPTARYPPDRREVSKGTQTEDVEADAYADITLMDIDPPIVSICCKEGEKK